MSDISQVILIFCAIFIGAQIYNVVVILKKILTTVNETNEFQKNIAFRITEFINFTNNVEGPLHRFLKKESPIGTYDFKQP